MLYTIIKKAVLPASFLLLQSGLVFADYEKADYRDDRRLYQYGELIKQVRAEQADLPVYITAETFFLTANPEKVFKPLLEKHALGIVGLNGQVHYELPFATYVKQKQEEKRQQEKEKSKVVTEPERDEINFDALDKLSFEQHSKREAIKAAQGTEAITFTPLDVDKSPFFHLPVRTIVKLLKAAYSRHDDKAIELIKKNVRPLPIDAETALNYSSALHVYGDEIRFLKTVFKDHNVLAENNTTSLLALYNALGGYHVHFDENQYLSEAELANESRAKYYTGLWFKSTHNHHAVASVIVGDNTIKYLQTLNAKGNATDYRIAKEQLQKAGNINVEKIDAYKDREKDSRPATIEEKFRSVDNQR